MADQSNPAAFDWQPQPAAAVLVARLIERCAEHNPYIPVLAQRMRDETGTRLVDWVDMILLIDDPALVADLGDAGYIPDSVEPDVWRHDHGVFPAIRLLPPFPWDGGKTYPAGMPMCIDVEVDSAADFAAATPNCRFLEGSPGSRLRIFMQLVDDGCNLNGVERHGWRRVARPEGREEDVGSRAAAKQCRKAFAQRRRDWPSDAEGFQHALDLIRHGMRDLMDPWVCSLFFAAERDYWMSRNAAARVQYERQQKLGLGWANHDHHTYRSSRRHFAKLIRIFEKMGFVCRERLYAGRKAGWGAQILEHADCGIIIFADVDLAPYEMTTDFAHEPLPRRDKLGTIGLWCKLHGESFLQAGMHHLECQFDFDAARQQLAALGVETLAPFTNWPHLKQAFTKAEMWPVAADRIDAVLAGGFITPEQAEQFRTHGAVGSHLEILERNDGYKGFNQTGINDIITRTDPRKA